MDEIPLSDWAATLGNPGILGLPIRYNSAGIVVSMLDGLSKLVKQGELTVASTKSARARDAVAATCLLSGVQHSVNNLERQERVGKVVNFFVIIPVYNYIAVSYDWNAISEKLFTTTTLGKYWMHH